MDLPLRYLTPCSWAESALADPLALLNDHAHLEKKAAANALELVNRWPGLTPPEAWVPTMTAVARDEIEHLSAVTKLLARRGGRLTRSHHNSYASALRKLVRLGDVSLEMMDRLMVSALIEARSCERFTLLAAGCDDVEIAKLYRGLQASEAGHYRVFIDLAMVIPDLPGAAERWEWMLNEEAAIMRTQPPGSRMHSGVRT